MDYATMKREKDARYEEYCKTYEDQLRLLGYISSLERDNESLRDTDPKSGRHSRKIKKLIKINDKDIKMYNKWLSKMPPVPEFK